MRWRREVHCAAADEGGGEAPGEGHEEDGDYVVEDWWGRLGA